MNSILGFFVDVFSQPAILVALIALIGLIVQKKSAAENKKMIKGEHRCQTISM